MLQTYVAEDCNGRGVGGWNYKEEDINVEDDGSDGNHVTEVGA